MPKRVSIPKEEAAAQSVKENKMVPVVSLYPHEKNYRAHPPEQIRKIKASLERFGQVRSIVVQECENGSYTIVAGHGVVEAATQLKMSELRADVFASWVPETEITGYLVADNLLGVDAVDDSELLAQILQEQSDAGFDLASMGSDEETLRQMLESLGDAYLGDGERDESEDELPEEVETRAKLGDIWQLGRHTVACMDSCDPETYTRLFEGVKPAMVFADPPYGINIVATNGYVGGGEAYDIPFGGVKNRAKGDVGGGASHMRKTGKTYLEESKQKGLGSTYGAKPFGSKPLRGSVGASNIVDVGKYAPVIGDDTTLTAITAYRLCAESLPDTVQIWWGANYYSHVLPPSKCWIVWDKENTGNFADAELAWCSDDSAVRIFKHMWNGMLKDSEHGVKRVHPTQKPIALAEWCYEKYGKEHDVIYDPFLGSGMSLIAAENTNRTVIGCELSPEYIDIIIARWEKISGQTPTLLQRTSEVSHA